MKANGLQGLSRAVGGSGSSFGPAPNLGDRGVGSRGYVGVSAAKRRLAQQQQRSNAAGNGSNAVQMISSIPSLPPPQFRSMSTAPPASALMPPRVQRGIASSRAPYTSSPPAQQQQSYRQYAPPAPTLSATARAYVTNAGLDGDGGARNVNGKRWADRDGAGVGLKTRRTHTTVVNGSGSNTNRGPKFTGYRRHVPVIGGSRVRGGRARRRRERAQREQQQQLDHTMGYGRGDFDAGMTHVDPAAQYGEIAHMYRSADGSLDPMADGYGRDAVDGDEEMRMYAARHGDGMGGGGGVDDGGDVRIMGGRREGAVTPVEQWGSVQHVVLNVQVRRCPSASATPTPWTGDAAVDDAQQQQQQLAASAQAEPSPVVGIFRRHGVTQDFDFLDQTEWCRRRGADDDGEPGGKRGSSDAADADGAGDKTNNSVCVTFDKNVMIDHFSNHDQELKLSVYDVDTPEVGEQWRVGSSRRFLSQLVSSTPGMVRTTELPLIHQEDVDRHVVCRQRNATLVIHAVVVDPSTTDLHERSRQGFAKRALGAAGAANDDGDDQNAEGGADADAETEAVLNTRGPLSKIDLAVGARGLTMPGHAVDGMHRDDDAAPSPPSAVIALYLKDQANGALNYAAQTERIPHDASPDFETGFIVHHYAAAYPPEDQVLVLNVYHIAHSNDRGGGGGGSGNGKQTLIGFAEVSLNDFLDDPSAEGYPLVDAAGMRVPGAVVTLESEAQQAYARASQRRAVAYKLSDPMRDGDAGDGAAPSNALFTDKWDQQPPTTQQFDDLFAEDCPGRFSLLYLDQFLRDGRQFDTTMECLAALYAAHADAMRPEPLEVDPSSAEAAEAAQQQEQPQQDEDDPNAILSADALMASSPPAQSLAASALSREANEQQLWQRDLDTDGQVTAADAIGFDAAADVDGDGDIDADDAVLAARQAREAAEAAKDGDARANTGVALRPPGYDEVLNLLPATSFFHNAPAPVSVSPADICQLLTVTEAGYRTSYHLQRLERDDCKFNSWEGLVRGVAVAEQREREDQRVLLERLTGTHRGLFVLDAAEVTAGDVERMVTYAVPNTTMLLTHVDTLHARGQQHATMNQLIEACNQAEQQRLDDVAQLEAEINLLYVNLRPTVPVGQAATTEAAVERAAAVTLTADDVREVLKGGHGLYTPTPATDDVENADDDDEQRRQQRARARGIPPSTIREYLDFYIVNDLHFDTCRALVAALQDTHARACDRGDYYVVSLTVSCLSLPGLGQQSPLLACFERNPHKGKFDYISQTERVTATCDPRFTTPIVLRRYMDEDDQILRFNVYHVDDTLTVDDSNLLGCATCSFQDLLQHPTGIEYRLANLRGQELGGGAVLLLRAQVEPASHHQKQRIANALTFAGVTVSDVEYMLRNAQLGPSGRDIEAYMHEWRQAGTLNAERLPTARAVRNAVTQRYHESLFTTIVRRGPYRDVTIAVDSQGVPPPTNAANTMVLQLCERDPVSSAWEVLSQTPPNARGQCTVKLRHYPQTGAGGGDDDSAGQSAQQTLKFMFCERVPTGGMSVSGQFEPLPDSTAVCMVVLHLSELLAATHNHASAAGDELVSSVVGSGSNGTGNVGVSFALLTPLGLHANGGRALLHLAPTVAPYDSDDVAAFVSHAAELGCDITPEQVKQGYANGDVTAHSVLYLNLLINAQRQQQQAAAALSASSVDDDGNVNVSTPAAAARGPPPLGSLGVLKLMKQLRDVETQTLDRGDFTDVTLRIEYTNLPAVVRRPRPLTTVQDAHPLTHQYSTCGDTSREGVVVVRRHLAETDAALPALGMVGGDGNPAPGAGQGPSPMLLYVLDTPHDGEAVLRHNRPYGHGVETAQQRARARQRQAADVNQMEQRGAGADGDATKCLLAYGWFDWTTLYAQVMRTDLAAEDDDAGNAAGAGNGVRLTGTVRIPLMDAHNKLLPGAYATIVATEDPIRASLRRAVLSLLHDPQATIFSPNADAGAAADDAFLSSCLCDAMTGTQLLQYVEYINGDSGTYCADLDELRECVQQRHADYVLSRMPKTYTLTLACRNLPKNDFLSKSDPLAVVYARDSASPVVDGGADDRGAYSFVGQTESQRNEHAPTFAKTVTMEYNPAVGWKDVKVCVYDVDDDDTVREKDMLCSVAFDAALLTAKTDGVLELRMAPGNGGGGAGSKPSGDEPVLVVRYEYRSRAEVVAQRKLDSFLSAGGDDAIDGDAAAAGSDASASASTMKVAVSGATGESSSEAAAAAAASAAAAAAAAEQEKQDAEENARREATSAAAAAAAAAEEAAAKQRERDEAEAEAARQATEAAAKIQADAEAAAAEAAVVAEAAAAAAAAVEAEADVPQDEVQAEEAEPATTVELTISCAALPKGDTFSKSDPIAAVYQKKSGEANYSLVGQTEHQDNEHDPTFAKKVSVTADADSEFKIIVYDTDKDERMDDKDRLGYCVVTASQLVAGAAVGPLPLLDKSDAQANKGTATLSLQCSGGTPVSSASDAPAVGDEVAAEPAVVAAEEVADAAAEPAGAVEETAAPVEVAEAETAVEAEAVPAEEEAAVAVDAPAEEAAAVAVDAPAEEAPAEEVAAAADAAPVEEAATAEPAGAVEETAAPVEVAAAETAVEAEAAPAEEEAAVAVDAPAEEVAAAADVAPAEEAATAEAVKSEPAAEPATTVELTISCAALPKGDTFSKSDPIAAVYQKKSGEDNYSLVGQTEHQDNEHDPTFAKKVSVTADADSEFKIIVYDTDKDERMDDKDRLGYCVVTASQLVAGAAVGPLPLLDKSDAQANKGAATLSLQCSDSSDQ